jgi:hypothetical protein
MRLEVQELLNCYKEHGWTATVQGQGVTFDPRGTPFAQQQPIIQECLDRSAKYQVPLPTTAEGWKQEYVYYKQRYQCLVDHGFHVDAAMSQDAYVAGRDRADAGKGLPQSEVSRAFEVCPPK